MWLNIADGTFGTPSYLLPNEGQGDVAVADFSGDGRLDLIFAFSRNSYSSFVVNSGDTMFSPLFLGPTHIAGSAATVLPLDFNGDGKMDFVADTSLLVNQGGGTSGNPITLGHRERQR